MGSLFKTHRIEDPHSGDVAYTDDPKFYKGRWYTPTEYARKVDQSVERARPRIEAFKQFKKTIHRFRSS